MMEKVNSKFMFIFLVLIIYLSLKGKDIMIKGSYLFKGNKEDKLTIVIDPGHGGRDPGKVGYDDTLEKDINLKISLKLKVLLEQNDITVIMTRSEDEGLYSDNDPNKKRTDLNNRIATIHESKADLAISIHQNSFEEEYVKGAQVFYHNKSEKGKELAFLIQEELKTTLDDGNHRVIKPNNNYYMLKNTECPLVIVECGYLSNVGESKLLVDEGYQEKVAWGIHLGVMRYVNNEFKKD